MTEPAIHEALIQPRGQAYRASQVVAHSHYLDPIDRGNGRLAGSSHVWGDATAATQSRVVDMLVEAARQAGLNPHRTAYVLAIARVESGFNPDAAAGTTSAYGLGQFIDRTAANYGISDKNRGDVPLQAKALVAHFLDNEAIANRRGQGEEYIYKYHHDGPNGDYGGLAVSRAQVMPYVDGFEKFLAQHVRPPPERPAPEASLVGDSLQAPLVPAAPTTNDVDHLQRLLTRLGYRDARGNCLRLDGVWGARTQEAVKAFQHAHGLPEVGHVGPRTRSALRRSEQSPSPVDPAHPDHALQKEISRQVEALGGPLNHQPPVQLRRLKAVLLTSAREHGVQRVDHLVLGRDGESLFVVQGKLDDPAHRRVQVSLHAAFATPLAQSRHRLQQAEFQCLGASGMRHGTGLVNAPAFVQEPAMHHRQLPMR
ncbi:XVIPCD domain-containing protein [Cognatiluteimonas telluris]|jgi:hypothetical protein|uniref:XVIPCD domain-containing protein n=1 Tax=Cognatiluteimonas telluris TaxID=1104775 RepID=UPI001408E27B|nr:XVIPCD domain-containing protein [Lysobacter telluris]